MTSNSRLGDENNHVELDLGILVLYDLEVLYDSWKATGSKAFGQTVCCHPVRDHSDVDWTTLFMPNCSLVWKVILREMCPNKTSWRPGRTSFRGLKNIGECFSLAIHDENNPHLKVDLCNALAYILTLPQWFNKLKQSVMLRIWVKDWRSAAPFQYLFEMVDYYRQGCLPHWLIFCKQTDKWREPSTMWKS